MRKKGPTRGRGGRGGAGPAATKLEPVPSFFKFFSPPRVPTGEVPMDEQDLEDLQETLQEDYELGCALWLPASGRAWGLAAAHQGWRPTRCIAAGLPGWSTALRWRGLQAWSGRL